VRDKDQEAIDIYYKNGQVSGFAAASIDPKGAMDTATNDTITKSAIDITTKATIDTATNSAIDITTKAAINTATKSAIDTATKATDSPDKSVATIVPKVSWKLRIREGVEEQSINQAAALATWEVQTNEEKEEPVHGVVVSVLGKRTPDVHAEKEHTGSRTCTSKTARHKKSIVEALSDQRNEDSGQDGGEEATSQGAAGKLTGASVGACQEP
jgi:hypothetical protein